MFGSRSSQTISRLHGQVTESSTDVEAVTEIVRAMEKATSPEEAITTALQMVRERFGWAYSSYWQLDQVAQVLRFAQESGTVNDEFRKVTLEASFTEGQGLSGRAWRSRELVFVRNLAELADCGRAPAASRAGPSAR
jgi:hypothetical protein